MYITGQASEVTEEACKDVRHLNAPMPMREIAGNIWSELPADKLDRLVANDFLFRIALAVADNPEFEVEC